MARDPQQAPCAILLYGVIPPPGPSAFLPLKGAGSCRFFGGNIGGKAHVSLTATYSFDTPGQNQISTRRFFSCPSLLSLDATAPTVP